MNNNIQESYCSFEVSKLLKEKGFNNNSISNLYYDEDGETVIFDITEFSKIIKPTHALAIEWIRVNFGIWIYLKNAEDNSDVYKPFFRGKDLDLHLTEFYNSPQEATEAALLYTLQNLIPLVKQK